MSRRGFKETWNALLDVSPDASHEEIKAAHKEKIKQYHPDLVSGLGDKLKALALQETKKLNAARDQGLALRNSGRSYYFSFRHKFEPASVKLVIIAESPPASGKYFYNPVGAVSEPLFAAFSCSSGISFILDQCPLLALSGQSNRTRFCADHLPLSVEVRERFFCK
jgi:DnaJ-like protein